MPPPSFNLNLNLETTMSNGKLVLVATDRATGAEERLTGEAQRERLEDVSTITGLTADRLRMALLMTLAGGPPVATSGCLYRFEE